MTNYPIYKASELVEGVTRFPKLNWPTDLIAVGEAFLVPLIDGVDPDGRSEAYLRVLADKHGKRLGRKFSCNKISAGLAISRIA